MVRYLSLFLALILASETSYICYVNYDHFIGSRSSQKLSLNNSEVVNASMLNKSSFTGEYEFSGSLKPLKVASIRTPAIANKYSVYVKNVYVGNCSQEIDEGNILIEFDCPQLAYKIAAAKSLMEQKYEYWNRIEKQKIENVVSSQDVLKAKTDYKSAFYEYMILQEEWKSLVIHSEFSGIASIPKVYVGEHVVAGKEIMKVMDNKNIIVDLSVSFDEYFQIGEYGRGVRISNDDGTAVASGYIVGIEAAFSSGLYNLRVKINDGYDYDSFKMGMQAKISIPKRTVYDVFVIPKSIAIEDESGVYICKLDRKLDNFYTKITPVEILDSDSSCYAISGKNLNNGDLVAYEGVIKRDNVLVSVREFFG